MAESVKLDANSLVSNLLEGGPTLPWTLKRKLPNGTTAEIHYRMQLLRAEESMAAIKAAQDTAKERGELQGYGDIYKEAQAHEVLVRAMRHTELRNRDDGTSYYPPVFVETRQLRASLTELEMAALLNAYEITKSTFAVVEGLEAHDIESWIARLSDPLRGPFHLSGLDSHHWPSLILLLAATARDLYQELGRELPSSEPSSASDPESSTDSTGSSGSPPSASITSDVTIGDPNSDVLEVKGDALISSKQAAEIVAKRKKKP